MSLLKKYYHKHSRSISSNEKCEFAVSCAQVETRDGHNDIKEEVLWYVITEFEMSESCLLQSAKRLILLGIPNPSPCMGMLISLMRADTVKVLRRFATEHEVAHAIPEDNVFSRILARGYIIEGDKERDNERIEHVQK